MASPDVISSSSSAADSSAEELERLRKLLLGPDYDRALRTIVTHSDTERVAGTLSEAIIQRNLHDNSVAEALGPIIDEAINNSIRNKPQRITRVIYPIIGPTIRKSVAKALADMVQTLNQILESSLSLRAWSWRYQAWRAGMKYGQFVLLKTLDFRVEQVLLIHRETGILLHAEHAEGVHTEDPELVSSMLTAISDFVADSFTGRTGNAENTALDNIRVGEFLLEIETGPAAVIVAAIRGTPSEEVSRVLRTALERVHLVFGRELEHFEGDRTLFTAASEILQPCLIKRHRIEDRRRTPWLALTAIAALLGYAGYTGYQQVQAEASLRTIRTQIQDTPGYLITALHKSPDSLRFEVLRSPASLLPEQLIGKLDSRYWQVQIEDRVAPLDLADYLAPLLAETLGLGNQVELQVSDRQQLLVRGALSAQQLQRLETSPLVATTFSRIDTSAVTLLPGPTPWELQRQQWHRLKAEIESTYFLFQPNIAVLASGEDQKLPALVEKLTAISRLAEQLPVHQWQLYVTGFADSAGTDAANQTVSEERSQAIRELLKNAGIASSSLVAWGAGHRPGSRLPTAQQRMVSLQLLHSPLGSPEPARAEDGEFP